MSLFPEQNKMDYESNLKNKIASEIKDIVDNSNTRFLIYILKSIKNINNFEWLRFIENEKIAFEAKYNKYYRDYPNEFDEFLLYEKVEKWEILNEN